jgi:cytochrome c biogenesis factor
MLRDDRFAELKESELKKAKLMFKKRKMLIIFISIKLNDEIINLIKFEFISKNNHSLNNYSLSLTQSKQFDQIRLIIISASVDLIDSRNQIRKMMTSKDQYVAQHARNAYIAIMTQSKVNFDLFLAAQIINSKEKDVKRLNKRLQ